ncbi:uncharacterized protein LOC133739371 isoform X2 [Rosa rugosa]|uniref:uncharacterized protein LOC133739371 isoform X2 n=1 Tax=Rosa rugosa TaxID=74645 RepID=UPI002B404AD9|nr:uncharacterized protein LOC133739371 isoform X2 [Rosa rugosa]
MVVNDVDLWVPRVSEGEKDEIPDYGHPDYFTVKVYHGGCIRDSKYVGGKVDFYDNVDKDRMSLVEVDNMVRQLNPAYSNQRIDYWYKVGDEDDELIKLETDIDVMIMCSAVPQWRLIILYLDHMELHSVFGEEDDDIFMYEDFLFNEGRSSSVIIEELPDDELRRKPTCVIEELHDSPRPGTSKGIVIREVDETISTQASIVGGLGPKEKGKQKLVEHDPSQKQMLVVYDTSKNQQSSGINFTSGGVGSSKQQSSGIGQQSSVQENEGSGLHDVEIDYLDELQSFGGLEYESEECSEHEESSEEDEGSDYDPCAHDEEYDHYGVDDDDEWLNEEDVEGTATRPESVLGRSTVDESLKQWVDEEDMFGVDDSDDEKLVYTINSDGEREELGLEFNPKTDMKNPAFKLKMKFATAQILRDALREYAIQGGWEYVFIKNDKTRIRVVCKEDNCPFELFASKLQYESTLMVKSYDPVHKCTRKFNNNMVRQTYLTSKFKDQIALNESWKPESLAKTMSASIRARVSRSMAYRAKRAALLEVEGSIKEQYARLRDYGRELQRADPATTIDIKCAFPNTSNLPVFKRMYICLGALKNGFKAGCRTIIGLDGAHLKSCFGGQLLTAVGIDANNTSWVIAYAMVEAESKDSWMWFLELMVSDLNIEHEGRGWTFISDKQKGLIPAFKEVVPRAHIRFCVRHMWTNFTKLFPGKVMKDQMWACAKSTTLPYFQKEMEDMKALDFDAYKWLTAKDRPAIHWCRAYFNTDGDCDIMINNLCESFNSWILEARGKPPVTMFEELRVKLMKRVAMRKEKMEAYHGNICPKPRVVIEKNKLRAGTDCIPTFNGGDIAEVENIDGSKNVVNLRMRTCTCRRWDLSGIPCKHAISAIYLKRHDPDDYVAACYLKKTYMSIYNNLIQPVNSMDLWSRTKDPAILPPQYSRQPGRPKIARMKDASERVQEGGVKLARVQRSLRCSNCKQVGHNLKTCQRHLPPKEKAAVVNKKRKLNTQEEQTSKNQSKQGKKSPMTKNELRQKAKKRAEYQRKKKAALKASKLEANKSTPKRSRPVQAASTQQSSRPVQAGSAPTSTRSVQGSNPSTKQAATPSRSSQRVRQNSGK